MLKDYYAILDVLPRASGEEIRRAFKRLALQFHPDKIGTGAATEPTSTVHTSEPSLAPKRPENALATASVISSNASTASFQSLSRDFTDIQEAYEVLGDVARRYLYDMNYQELLALQQHRQQEERKRFDAHARAVAEAARQVRERECLRQQQQQQQHQQQQQRSHQPQNTNSSSTIECSTTAADLRINASVPSPPHHAAPLSRGQGAKNTGVSAPSSRPDDAPLDKRPHKRRESTENKKGGNRSLGDLAGDTSGDAESSQVHYLFTAPTRSHEVGRCTEEGRARRQECDCTAKGRHTSSRTQRRISGLDTKYTRHRMATTLPAVFVLSSSVPFSWGETAAQTCPSVAEPSRSPGGRWYRHTAPRDGEGTEEPELPVEYYYQRSIERTLRVFFGVQHLE
nr:unnamed protein product [Leishmania braziliensis]